MKKFLSILLATALVLGCIGGFVLAADETTEGDTAEPTPAPSKVDNAVCLVLDVPSALVKNVKVPIDSDNPNVAPFTVEGRTMVPIRFISEAFGAEVGWEPETETVSITLGSKKIELQINSDKMYVNGAEKILEAPAMIKDSRTFVPLRACAEALGKQVLWEDSLSLIVISDKKITFDGADEMLDVVSKFVLPVLTDLKVDGDSVADFNPEVFEYNVILPFGTTTVPEIEAVAESCYTVEVKKPTELPGVAEIKVSYPKISGMFNRYRVNIRAMREIEISVSHHEDGNPPENTRDGDLTTRCAMDGPCWIRYDFATPQEISAVYVACWKSNERQTKLTIQISEDGVNFETIFDGLTSVTEDVLEEFKLLKKTTVKSIKILGHGNTSESSSTAIWTSILEVDWK